jgi:hypothetical protein
VVCTDSYHRDEPDYARLGHHHVGTLRLVQGNEDGPGHLAWTGPRADPRDTISTSGITLSWPGIAPALPQKPRHRDDGTAVWRFTCRCGRDVQRSEPDLAALIIRYAEAFPGRRPEVDVARL